MMETNKETGKRHAVAMVSAMPAYRPLTRTWPPIHLVSLEENIDTTSAAGELVFHVLGGIAHFERRLISERTRDGITAARKCGRRPGRPPLGREPVSAA